MGNDYHYITRFNPVGSDGDLAAVLSRSTALHFPFSFAGHHLLPDGNKKFRVFVFSFFSGKNVRRICEKRSDVSSHREHLTPRFRHHRRDALPTQSSRHTLNGVRPVGLGDCGVQAESILRLCSRASVWVVARYRESLLPGRRLGPEMDGGMARRRGALHCDHRRRRK